jgi:hypothetical protein
MQGKEAICECPIGFEQPYCAQSKQSKFYCDINACKNGGTCVISDENDFNSMKCLCKSGFTGVFCEISKSNVYYLIKRKANLLAFFIKVDLEDYNQVPSICKTNNKTTIIHQPLRASKTPFSNESYYLVQG